MKHCSVPSTSCATKFVVATSNGLGGDTYKKRDGRTTDRRTDGPTDGRTTDRLWYKINKPFFLKKMYM